MVNYGDVNDVNDTSTSPESVNGDSLQHDTQRDTQDEILSHFQEVTGKTEVEECLTLLDESNWNLEQAVQLAFNPPAPPLQPAPPRPPSPPLQPASSDSSSNQPNNTASSNNTSVNSVVNSSQQYRGVNFDENVRQRLITDYSNNNSNPLLNPGNPNFIGPRLNSMSGPIINRQNRSIVQTLFGSFWNVVLWPIRTAYKIVCTVFQFALTFLFVPGPPTQRHAGQEVEKYISEFDAKYGMLHPRFYHGTYKEAVSHAKRHLRFLLVFLHNEDNTTSVQFASNVVCTSLLKSIVEDNLLFWSCSVKKQEGECVAESLNKAKPPFIALLCFKEGQMRMVYKNQGYATVEQVITRLTTSIVENEPHLNRQRSSRDRVSESSSTQQIMLEQDAAYHESLVMDQERARQKKEVEDSVRMIQEEEERKQREKEDKITAREALREKLKLTLPEPTKGDTLSLLFRLPNGSRVSRKFSPTSTIRDIYNFALTCDDSPPFFTLASNFPKRVLPAEGDAHYKTCEEMGIQNSTTLFVQELGSEDEDSSGSEAEV